MSWTEPQNLRHPLMESYCCMDYIAQNINFFIYLFFTVLVADHDPSQSQSQSQSKYNKARLYEFRNMYGVNNKLVETSHACTRPNCGVRTESILF